MNAAFERKLQVELDALKAAGTYKHLRHLTKPMAAQTHVEEVGDAGDVIMMSSNNYLGLADHPDVIAAGIEGLERFGAGTASVRFISGTFTIHRQLEKKIAEFLGCEAALTYSSCWSAMEGLLPTIAGPNDTILYDEFNHAASIDAARLSGATCVRYRHADPADLATKLRQARGTAFIVTDGVFALEGDLAPLPEILEVARRSDAVLIVDDSHGTGVLGAGGRGTVEHFGLTGKVDIIVGTLGKALGGAAGGFVAGERVLIETLVQRSRTQLFSNALSAVAACIAIKAIEIVETHPELRDRLRENAEYFRQGLIDGGFTPIAGSSAIVSIFVGETAAAIAMSDRLLEEGVFVTGIGKPLVPEGRARVRVQMSAALERGDLDWGLTAFKKIGREVGLLPGERAAT